MLTASGNVRVTDRRDAEGPVVAQAERLVSDLPARTATLHGSFARVSQKGNSVEGAVIELDQLGERFAVKGPGRLRFHSRADISGRRSEQPQPVDLVWKEGVQVLGKARTAELTGDVQLATGGDLLKCQYMRVIFSPDEEPPKTPASRAASRPADAVQQEAQRYRARRIATVMAQKDVVLESVRNDEQGFLLRRVRLDKAKELHYEARLQRVNCFGPGRMVVEDYRPPAEGAPGAGDVLEVGDIAHPSQSVFEWTKAMEMDQKQLAVKADGGVRMVHRSGAEIVLLKELPVPPYKKLPKGRRTMLVADHVVARFDQDDQKPAKGQELRGPKLGELILFEARGEESDVSMVDGPRQVLCRMLEYRSRDDSGRRIDTATVHGSLPGEPPRDAVLYYKEPGTNKLQASKSPKLIWDRRTNRVWAPGGVEIEGSR